MGTADSSHAVGRNSTGVPQRSSARGPSPPGAEHITEHKYRYAIVQCQRTCW